MSNLTAKLYISLNLVSLANKQNRIEQNRTEQNKITENKNRWHN